MRQAETVMQNSDQKAFGESEGGVAAGPGRYLTWATALTAQVGFSLRMSQEGQLVDELVPSVLRQSGQGGVGQPGMVVSLMSWRRGGDLGDLGDLGVSVAVGQVGNSV